MESTAFTYHKSTYTPHPTNTPNPPLYIIRDESTEDSGWLPFTSSILIEVIKCIAGFITACTWPLLIILLLFGLKIPILTLIPELRKLRYGNFELEFKERVEKLEIKADEAALPSPVQTETTQPENINYLYRLADISPSAAVQEAWRLIEIELRSIAEGAAIDLRPNARPVEILRMLMKNELIMQELFSFNQELRNIAAHKEVFEFEVSQVVDYINLSLRVVNALKKIASQEINRE